MRGACADVKTFIDVGTFGLYRLWNTPLPGVKEEDIEKVTGIQGVERDGVPMVEAKKVE